MNDSDSQEAAPATAGEAVDHTGDARCAIAEGTRRLYFRNRLRPSTSMIVTPR